LQHIAAVIESVDIFRIEPERLFIALQGRIALAQRFQDIPEVAVDSRDAGVDFDCGADELQCERIVAALIAQDAHVVQGVEMPRRALQHRFVLGKCVFQASLLVGGKAGGEQAVGFVGRGVRACHLGHV
jgi:hypothetical protein